MKKEKIKKIAIIMMYFLSMGQTALNPGISKISAAFPKEDYSTIVLIATLPGIFMVVFSLISGAYLGKRGRHRRMATIGTLIFILGGLIPYFYFSSLSVILVCRALIGIATGLLTPIGYSLILGNYSGVDKVKLLGIGTLVMNAGGIIFQLLVGVLSDISWNYMFLVHILGILVFPFLLFIPNKEIVATGKKQDGNNFFGFIKIFDLSALLISFVFCLNFILIIPVMVNMSGMFSLYHIESGTLMGIASAMFTLGGCFAGVIIGWLVKKTNYTLVLVYFVLACGIGILIFGRNGLIISLGALVVGIAFTSLIILGFSILGKFVPKEKISFSTSVLSAGSGVGSFLSTYYIGAVKNYSNTYILDILKIDFVLFLCLGVLFAIISVTRRSVIRFQ